MLNIFSCASWPPVCLFWRNVWAFCPFFDWVVCFDDIKPYELFVNFVEPSLVSHIICKYFLPICGLPFHFVYCFLWWADAFEFKQVPFVYFCFYFKYSGKWIEKEIAAIYVESVLPMFSSRNFIVSSLTFRPLIHFYLIFVYSIKEWSNFTFLCVVVYFSQQHLLKRLSFQHCIVLPPLS